MGQHRKNKKKVWHDKRSIKLQKKWYGRDERIRSFKKVEDEIEEIHYDKDHKFLAEAPSEFSLIDNAEETIKYFNTIIHMIEKKRFKQGFFIDASKVCRVTTETLMYMIAIIYNIKANRALQYVFEGNLPVHSKARRVFENSGYLNYFKMKRLKMPQSMEYVKIVSGKLAEPETAKRMCDFVIEKWGTNKSRTSTLYTTLIELMSNTAKHAYNNKHTMMQNSWYLYALYEEDKIKFSFVDTGEGIPNTIKKKFLEKVIGLEDSKLLEFSLTQSGRSETGLPNRGHGLPNLYKQVRQGMISDFYVLSGKGSCKYNEESKELNSRNYDHRVYGTIFSFTIRKEIGLCIK